MGLPWLMLPHFKCLDLQASLYLRGLFDFLEPEIGRLLMLSLLMKTELRLPLAQ